MNCRLAPSILSYDHSDLRSPAAALANAGIDLIHLDIMDGQFVPPITFGAGVACGIRTAAKVELEAHLMTLTPERHFEAFAEAGCSRIYFHVEATAHAHRLAQTLRGMRVQAGVAINPGTPIEAIEPLLDSVDAVLVMTVNPGWGGQEFVHSAMEKVRRIRSLQPQKDIEVDGGIDPHTLRIAREAGANLFVVGSYLARASNLGEAVKALRKECA